MAVGLGLVSGADGVMTEGDWGRISGVCVWVSVTVAEGIEWLKGWVLRVIV